MPPGKESMYRRKRYPVFELKSIQGDGTKIVRRTTKKKAFLRKLDRLQSLQAIKASFVIRYAPGVVNESVDYTCDQFKEMARAARIFTAKDEIEFAMRGRYE